MAHWIDLGDGLAISPIRIVRLEVLAPSPTSTWGLSPCLEAQTWGLGILDGRTSVKHRVGYFPSEGEARALARRIVAQMLEAADAY